MLTVGFVGASNEKNHLPGSTYMLPISIGQPYHNSEKLEATVACLNRKGFAKGTVLVASTLQRHTLKLTHKKLDPNECYQLAKDNAAKWLENSIPILQNLNHPFDIVDWDILINTQKFHQRFMELETLYKSGGDFHRAVDDSINVFITRVQKRETSLCSVDEISKIRELCYQYLLEECAVLINQAGLGYQYEIYPRPHPAATKIAYELFIRPNYPNELKRISLRFARKKVTEAT